MLAALSLAIALQGVQAKPPAYERRSPTRDGTGVYYMGREIAQFMSHLGAGWLDRPERDEEEGISKLLDILNLQNGMVVADIGAGSGTLTLPMAKRVSPGGKVLAVDIQTEMLTMVQRKAKAAGLGNVRTILGTENDPKLSPNSVDLMLLVDVYHELGDPVAMTRNMIRGLKKGGRLVLVEYRGEDPDVPIKPLHKMTEAQVKREMSVWPLDWERTDESLPVQHVIFFRKQ